MNIFYLDEETDKCAEYHVNSHVVKMPLETAQLLCSAHWATGETAPYKKTHINHPSAIWARQSKENYVWLVKLGFSLLQEYCFRYGRVHGCTRVIDWCSLNVPKLPDLGFTPPTPAMGSEYIIPNNSLESYRKYYREGKKHLHLWKNRNIPYWI